jgi:hypothetical protein
MQVSSPVLEGSMALLGIEDLSTPYRRAKKGSARRIAAGLPALHSDDLESLSPKKRSSSSSRRPSRTSESSAGSPQKVSLSVSSSSSNSWVSPLGGSQTSASPRKHSSSPSKRTSRTPGTRAGSPPRTPSTRKRDKVSSSVSSSSSKSWVSPLGVPQTSPSKGRRSTKALLSPGQIPESPSSKMKARMSKSMAVISEPHLTPGGPGGQSRLFADFLQESQHGQTPQFSPPVYEGKPRKSKG